MKLKSSQHLFAEIRNAPEYPIPYQNMFDVHLQDLSSIVLTAKRDDQLHPVISGNKWRKLKYLILAIEASGKRSLTSMGGPYSNLLHSLAYICNRLNWSFKCYVRGHAEQPLTKTLLDIKRWGGQIEFVNRRQFKMLRQDKTILADEQADEIWIDEGGFDPLALKGCMESFLESSNQPDYILMATATGASIAGLALGAWRFSPKTQVIGISVLNNAEQVEENIDKILPPDCPRPRILKDYIFGGYAKQTHQLKAFIERAENKLGLPLEPVYSAKSLYAAVDLIKQGYFAQSSHVQWVHCGGLQASRKT